MNLILIVDDDPELRDTVGFLLKESGYGIETASDGQSMNEQIERHSPDLILLDVSLGNESGFELAMQLRKTSIIPIIMLTGKGSETDRVVGLELGADDYITKPYHSAELLARVKSVLRRSRITSESQLNENRSVAKFQSLKCDMTSRKLFNSDGGEISLSSGEFLLLSIFLSNPNRVLSRERLLDLSHRESTFDRSIDVQIMRLRRKVELNPTDPQLIQAVRSIGYIFATNVEWS